jgi:hypothetical protein
MPRAAGVTLAKASFRIAANRVVFWKNSITLVARAEVERIGQSLINTLNNIPCFDESSLDA